MEEEKAASNWLKETQKGYLRIATLILLNKKPFHGYEIMKEINGRTRGFWKPTAGGIYPILKDLQKSGYVESEWVVQRKRKRRTYRITEGGKAVLERALTKEGQIANSMNDLIREFMRDVLDMKTVPMPRIPNFFSVFLDERKEKPEDTVNVLESKRSQIENMIEALQKELGTINKRLDHLKKSRRNA